MPRFRYSALQEDGRLINGQIDAANEQSVVQRLEAGRQHAVKVSRIGGGRPALNWRLERGHPTAQDVTVFTRELAWLLRAGLHLSRALEVLAGEFESPAMSDIVTDLRAIVRSGDSFSDALARHQRAFSAYYINMVRIAELSGTLGTVLERIADARDRELKIRRKLHSALIYPSILILVAMASVIFILTTVIPRLHEMFGDPGAAVPDSARRLIAVSDWLVSNGWGLLFFLVLLGIGAALALRNPRVKASARGLALRSPLLGGLMRLSVAAEFCRTLGILLGAGVGLPAALDLMRGAFGIGEFQNVLGRMAAMLRKGEDYLAPVETSWLFPRLLPKMLRVGEETGNLVPALQQLTAMFEEKLEVAAERMLTLLEPVIILTLSIVVGFIIMTVMNAIISVNDLAI